MLTGNKRNCGEVVSRQQCHAILQGRQTYNADRPKASKDIGLKMSAFSAAPPRSAPRRPKTCLVGALERRALLSARARARAPVGETNRAVGTRAVPGRVRDMQCETSSNWNLKK